MKKLPRIVYILLACITVYFATNVVPPIVANIFGGSSPSTSICAEAHKLEHISCGEEIILVEPDGGKNQRDKEIGFAAILKQDFTAGIEALERDFKASRDPESLIAIENSKIRRDRLTNVKTITVVIPAHGAPKFVGVSILKGVAFAQKEWNQSGNWKLLVAVADDFNQPDRAKQIAEKLVKSPDVLAILGHYSSTVTSEVIPIYNKHHTLLLSATTTAAELTSNGDDNYFFRVLGSTKVSAENLAKKWGITRNKIAIFSTSNGVFSQSFRKHFLSYVPADLIVKEFDLGTRNNAALEIAIAKEAGAKNIIIIQDAFTDPNERERVLSVIKANKGEMMILGASPLKDAYLFQAPLYLKNLVITVPIHPSNKQFIDLAKLNRSPDWWGSKSQVNERTINSFDAIQVLEKALDRSKNRAEVRSTIGSPNFNAHGITGTITFRGSDRAERIDTLVTPSTCGDTKCNFELAH
jgi:ABC-type branched-subunit amino acid transport system substrate-binding protein